MKTYLFNFETELFKWQIKGEHTEKNKSRGF